MGKISLNGNDWKIKDFLGEDWIWRNSEKRETGDVRFWKPAQVPGSVTDDMLRCGQIPDPHFEKNSLLAEWVPERTWVYRKEFVVEESLEQKKVRLCFEGVDYDAKFYLNDQYLGEHHSMYTPVSFDVTKLVRTGEKNLLSVVLEKAPDEQPQVSKTRYVKTHKSRMTYWWDFCPRMIHLGIWDDVYLKITKGTLLGQIDLETELSDDHQKAVVRVKAPVEDLPFDRQRILVEAMVSMDGVCLADQREFAENGSAEFEFEVEDPNLWWPNGYGSQPLYELRLFVYETETDREASDEKKVRFGIRSLTFAKNETPDETARPYTACVNGRRIYMKGYNWVPIDAMYGVRRTGKLQRLLRLAKDAHVNCLRIWGGGLLEREDFYDLCDENGILIWQEFIQSSSGIENEPSSDPDFLKLMEREAAVIIPRKKHHPSLALWGGGNELSGSNNEMINMKEPVIRILGEQVKKYDPSRYFLESSPTGRMFNNTLENIEKDPLGLHDVHGPWEHQGLTAQYTLYNAGTSLLSSEFGVEGMTNIDALYQNMSPEHLWPPSRDNEYYFHRGSWWNNFILMQECFEDKLTNIEDAVRGSQFMQYEGLKYAVEANRRRALTCSGTFPWQFNEPFPNNTCTCSVDYYAAPKPAYYGVKKAYSPNAVSAGFKTQSLKDEKELAADIYWQSSEGIVPCRIRAEIYSQNGMLGEKADFGKFPGVDSEKSVRVGNISCSTDQIADGVFYLVLTALGKGDAVLAENRYLFTKTTLAELLALGKTQVEASLVIEDPEEKARLVLENKGPYVAAGVWMEDAEETKEEGYVYFGQNYLYLLPGEKQSVLVEKNCADKKKIRISSWNTREKIIEWK